MLMRFFPKRCIICGKKDGKISYISETDIYCGLGFHYHPTCISEILANPMNHHNVDIALKIIGIIKSESTKELRFREEIEKAKKEWEELVGKEGEV